MEEEVLRPTRRGAASRLGRSAGQGLLQALIDPDPRPDWRSGRQRWSATALALVGSCAAFLIVVRLVVLYLGPHNGGGLRLGFFEPGRLLQFGAVLVPFLFIVHYPRMAWRVAYLLAVLFPLLPGENLSSLLVLLAAFCLVGLRLPRRVLWWMWLLMLVPTWLWLGTNFERSLLATIFLAGATLALDASATSRRARRALDEQREHAQLEQARRAVLEERTRIAREMHDVVAHHMSMIAVQAETAPYRVPGLPEQAKAELASLSAAAREAMADMRRLLGVLRSEEPAERAPQPQLTDIPELVETARRAGVAVDLSMSPSGALVPSSVGICAYRIVQEALSNAGRHARGAQVAVALEQELDALCLEVRNGPALEPAEAPEGRPGHGLAGMRERVGVLGGALTAGPTEEGGFAVSAVLPLGQW